MKSQWCYRLVVVVKNIKVEERRVTEDMFQERILHSLMDQADSKEQDILRMVENSMYLLIIMMDHLRKRIQVVILESDR